MTNARKQDNDYFRRCESALETIGLAPMLYIKDMSTVVPHAMKWLAKELDDLNVEYHSGYGWQVSSCYFAEGKMDDYGVVMYWDDWISDEVDGTLAGALLLSVEKVASGKRALAETKEIKEIESDSV